MCASRLLMIMCDDSFTRCVSRGSNPSPSSPSLAVGRLRPSRLSNSLKSRRSSESTWVDE